MGTKELDIGRNAKDLKVNNLKKGGTQQLIAAPPAIVHCVGERKSVVDCHLYATHNCCRAAEKLQLIAHGAATVRHPYRMEISMATQSREIGIQAKNKPGHWVQTERKAHEAWAGLIARKPTAAMLLHHLVAQMGHQNAVVVSQKTLSKLIGRSLRTVQYAVKDLVAERWISVVKLNGPGTVSAYVVNDRVA